MSEPKWVGTDEVNGLPSMDRPDAPKSRWSFEAIAAVERPHDFAVSPDGSTIVFILDREGSDLWTVDMTGGVPRRVTTHRHPTAYWEDTTPAWSPDGKTVAYAHEGAVWTVPMVGGLPVKLAEGDSPVWVDDDTLVITVDRDQVTRLATVKVSDPWPVALTPKGQEASDPRISPDGKALAYVGYPSDDRNASQIWWLDLITGENRRVTGEPGMHDLGPSISPDGSAMVFTSERSGWYQAHLIDLGSGVEHQLTKGEGDLTGLRWHSDGTRLVATRTFRGRTDLVTITIPDGGVSTIASGGTWSSPEWANDSIIAVFEDHQTPAQLVRVGPDGTRLALSGPPPLQVTSAPYASFEEVEYAAPDGMLIHGFLFRPAPSAAPAPAVVYPHGGPTDAYTDAWDGHAQYFVDKGYAWLAINFRGSTGYGRQFERANHGVWGVADTADCLAAAEFLGGLDWVDGSRIAIFGASYGSYMALASMTYDPKYRFACGVLKYGDSDIGTSWAQGDRGGREDLERMMGSPSESRDAYRAGSPLADVDMIQRPLLIAHGERDERVHPDQSAQLVAELKRLDKQFEYLTYPTEGHGLLRAGPQVHFYRRLERFLDWHLM